MKMVELEYAEFEGKPQEWKIEDCTFDDVNLIVGKNATGKTRTLNVISNLAHLLSDWSELGYAEGDHLAKFDSSGQDYCYYLEHHNREVFAEKLMIDGKVYLERKQDGTGRIYAKEIDKSLRFQIPLNQVAVFAKRDSIQHPFLDCLHQWGEGVRRYNFGKTLGQDHLLIKASGESDESRDVSGSDLKDPNKVLEIFVRGEEEFGQVFTGAVIDDMASIGYRLEDIGVGRLPGKVLLQGAVPGQPLGFPTQSLGLYVKEADTEFKIYQTKMSQGMFRALSLLVQINYSLLATETTCVLIDDIGEGLDYTRSSALVKLVIEKLGQNEVQLIMATNDRFIMNAVPLEHWIVLERRGGICRHHNYRNSKAVFEKFELTGLSNFDLFSTGYYLRDEQSR